MTHTNVNESVVYRNVNCQHFFLATGLKKVFYPSKSHFWLHHVSQITNLLDFYIKRFENGKFSKYIFKL